MASDKKELGAMPTLSELAYWVDYVTAFDDWADVDTFLAFFVTYDPQHKAMGVRVQLLVSEKVFARLALRIATSPIAGTPGAGIGIGDDGIMRIIRHGLFFEIAPYSGIFGAIVVPGLPITIKYGGE